MGNTRQLGKKFLAEYTQYGIEGQHYTASNARDRYVKVPVVNLAKSKQLTFDTVRLSTRRVEYTGMRVSIS